MPRIFIFTAGQAEAREHLRDSILNPVPIEWLDAEVGNEDSAYFRDLLTGTSGFYAWGAVPGQRNPGTWEAMNPGDIVLTVYDNHYHFVSSVIGKIHSRALARRIWGEDKDGKTWEYMYLLSRPDKVQRNVSSKSLADRLNKAYRGFTQISSQKIDEITLEYGSVKHFIEREFNASVPLTHINRELQGIESEADQSAGFDPDSISDGRKKVLREIVRRQGQPKFRKELMLAYENRCVVTGCGVLSVLEGAHIAPYLGKESNSIQNGLLLRADIHTLFDLGQLKVNPNGRIEVDATLSGTLYESYHGQSIRAPIHASQAPSQQALTRKYQLIL